MRNLVSILVLLAVAAGVVTATRADEDRRSELSRLLGEDAAAGFARARDPRPFEFPRDHGPHPEYRNEWWYLTGNLDASDGRRFGYELTFFRFALAPETPEARSAWRTNQVYIAHFALTDAERREFYVAERSSRAALGLAGAQATPLSVWIDDWRLEEASRSDTWRLSAEEADFALDLEIEALKPPVLHGRDGLSQKSAEPGNASYYYSISRWQSRGRLRIGYEEVAVTGLSWLDREWSSSALGDDQQGWDWFALQLADDSELMFYQLRKRDGSADVFSSGTMIDTDGKAQRLGADDVEIHVHKYWTSPRGDTYPGGWQIAVPALDLKLRIVPVLDDQELATLVRYWEGAVDVTGTRSGRPISGRGYVELTGYADP